MSLDRLSRKKSSSLDSHGESISPSENSISSNVCSTDILFKLIYKYKYLLPTL